MGTASRGSRGFLVLVNLQALETDGLSTLLLANDQEVRSVLQVEGGTVPGLFEFGFGELVQDFQLLLLEVDEHNAV